MFIRTTNLLLRPGWREDATPLVAAFARPEVVMTLANAPWPYSLADAVGFIDHASEAVTPERLPELLIVAPEGARDPIGGIGLVRREAGVELGYWIAPEHRGRGFATEAARAIVAAARDSLRLDRLISGHFVDNPASGRVLEKIGFGRTGLIAPRHCRARGYDVECVAYALDLRARPSAG